MADNKNEKPQGFETTRAVIGRGGMEAKDLIDAQRASDKANAKDREKAAEPAPKGEEKTR